MTKLADHVSRTSRRLPAGVSAAAPPPPTYQCERCKDTGWLLLVQSDNDPGRLVPCACRQDQIEQRRVARLRRTSHIEHLGNMTFDRFLVTPYSLIDMESRQREAMELALKRAFSATRQFAVDPRGWLILSGGCGTGKTHLAAAIANERISNGLPALFISVPDLFDYLRGGFAAGVDADDAYQQRMEEIKTHPLLILDDLGMENSTTWVNEKLYQIINYRHRAELPTVITTNRSIDALGSALASRIVDWQTAEWFQFTMPDFRRTNEFSAERLPYNLDRYNLLPHLAEKTFKTFTSDPFAAQLVSTYVKNHTGAAKRWVFIRGPSSSGKTHLAAAAANTLIQSGNESERSVFFVSVPDLLDCIREMFSNLDASSVTVFNHIRDMGVLILDDLDRYHDTGWAAEKLFQLINYRFVRQLPTIVIARDTARVPESIAARIGDESRCLVISLAKTEKQRLEMRM